MSERKKHEILVIGSGPGGYVAAIRAAQKGKSVGLIEKDLLGGCCLNVGCIPTKTLLANAAVLHQIKRAEEFGITTGPIHLHYEKMKARKDQVIAKMRSGLEGLLRSNQITVYKGKAQFETPKTLKVQGVDNLYVEAEHIVIATGSIPLDIPAFPCDHRRILNSSSLLELTEIPKTLLIVGGGYIGCEFASLFQELGTSVTIVESMPTILAAQGTEIAQFMTREFQNKNMILKTDSSVQKIDSLSSHVRAQLADGSTIDAEYALVAVGRKVYTEGLHLEKAGLKTNAKGAIETDAYMQTEVRGIYAIGDVTAKSMLAHVASHQAIVAIDHALGSSHPIRYNAVPAVVFTSPEIATVGLTLEQAKTMGIDAIAAQFPFLALGKAQAAKDPQGFVQIISDRKTGQIIGAIAIGHEASNLIGEMALAIENELTLDCLTQTIHAHPTLAEAWHEAAWIAKGAPINFPPKAKR